MKLNAAKVALAQRVKAEPFMTKTLTRTQALVDAGLVMAGEIGDMERIGARYAIAITPQIAALIDRDDPLDPITAQFVPTLAELTILPNENADPISDQAFSPVKGLVHRYPDRVLLKVVSVCPVYCRFCFRREMVGPGGESLVGDDLQAAIAYISARPEIFEVIMTGGDPFMLSPRRVAELTQRLAAVPHVKVLRWHTRVPVVDSGRVTAEFVAALRAKGVATWVAIHANHPREFSDAACDALAMMADAGIALVSQSVLLKGVNDDVETLAALMRAFIVNRVKPYYLHHPDLAPGTSHFRGTIAQGRELMRQLRLVTSGLAQPIYVLDVPGGAIKAPLGPDYVRSTADGMQVLSGEGSWLDYKG
jgi:lysine 2,3-aminomutase